MRRLLLTPLVLAAVGCAAVDENTGDPTVMPPDLVAAITPPVPEPQPPSPPPVVQRPGRTGVAKTMNATTVYAFEPDRVYPVTVSPGRITVLQLGDGEEISRQPVIGDPDPSRWMVDLTRGANDSVVVRSGKPGIATNMLITTTAGDYQVDITSRANGGMDRVRWTYPTAALPAAKGRPQPEFDPNTFSRNFEIDVPSGAAPRWKPEYVIEAAGKTYIAFPPRLGPMAASPALFAVGDAGKTAIPFRIRNRFYEVDTPLTTAELQLDGATVRIRRTS
ncbi:MAG: TrbG/VirB9 family P-type conjugative transfer protein [Rhodospirillales bacterium]|nr:TrbG/VirB9 family P-type conjugative transfer protein [Rhodospirillales bacterium]